MTAIFVMSGKAWLLLSLRLEPIIRSEPRDAERGVSVPEWTLTTDPRDDFSDAP
jgi:hypothetical protein